MTKDRANKWLLQNLFWMVPLNFILIIGGIGLGVVQRGQQMDKQTRIEENISVQLQNDSVFKKKQDSALINTNELRELIKQY